LITLAADELKNSVQERGKLQVNFDDHNVIMTINKKKAISQERWRLNPGRPDERSRFPSLYLSSLSFILHTLLGTPTLTIISGTLALLKSFNLGL
jgi:hypothetical protein